MKFRKCTSFLLAMLLLVSNVGLAFNVHYCGDQIASVSSIYNIEEVCAEPELPTEKACCAEASKDHKSCCEDKTVDLQDQSDDKIVKTFSFSSDGFFLISEANSPLFTGLPALAPRQISIYLFESHLRALYKLYSQYIFYA